MQASPFPLGLVVALGIVLLVSRPWLDARRPIMSLALILGVALGPVGGNLVREDLLSGMTPVSALCSGWLALLAAESWDAVTLRRARSSFRILWLVVPAVALGWYFGAILIACAAIALDPDAAREGLRLMVRPTTGARLAPTIAAIALGLALLASCLADPRGLLVGTPALLIGAALGLIYAGLLRLADGRALVLTLLITLPILGAGIAHALEVPVFATFFVAGLLLAQDTARRDLIFSALREYERPVTAALLLLAGVSLPLSGEVAASWPFWVAAVILVLIKPVAWRLVPAGGLVWRQVLPMSPLVIPLAAATGVPWIAAAVALAFVLGELLSRLPERRTT